jgi:hypothetical protein
VSVNSDGSPAHLYDTFTFTQTNIPVSARADQSRRQVPDDDGDDGERDDPRGGERG